MADVKAEGAAKILNTPDVYFFRYALPESVGIIFVAPPKAFAHPRITRHEYAG
jgi:hypothetical protein